MRAPSAPKALAPSLLLQASVKRKQRLNGADQKRGLSKRLKALEDSLFPQQRAFIDDPDTRLAALCTRRAGKTHSAAAWLLREAHSPGGGECLYTTTTSKAARSLMWEGEDGVLEIAKKHKIPLKTNETLMRAVTSTGGVIRLGGADNKRDIEQYRGRKHRLVLVDEPASFRPHLEPLIEEVLEPSVMDLNGTIALIGTPGRIHAGLYYEATREDAQRNQAWTVHRWSVKDNPHVPHFTPWLENLMAEKGWTWETPKVRREYLGQWCKEEETLVYSFNPSINLYDGQLPEVGGWQCTLGVDFGYRSESAWRIVWFSEHSPYAYLGPRYSATGLDVTGCVERTKEFIRRYQPVVTVVDTGGLGVMIAEEMNRRHELNVRAAEKRHKAEFIELFNDDLKAGRIKAPAGDPIINEWALLQWAETDSEEPQGDKADKREEDPRFANHDSDATLYAWREAHHFMHEPVEDQPKEGTSEWYQHEEDMMEQRAVEQMETQLREEKEADAWLYGEEIW
jgi:hypothetical protein